MNALEAAVKEALSKLLDKQVKAAQKTAVKPKKGKKAKGGRQKMSDAEKALFIAQNDAECVKVFTKAGYKDVKPRVNVLTYGKVKEDGTKTGWLGQGRIVRKGERSLRVGPFNLFHISQTQELVEGQVVPPAANAEAPQTVQ